MGCGAARAVEPVKPELHGVCPQPDLDQSVLTKSALARELEEAKDALTALTPDLPGESPLRRRKESNVSFAEDDKRLNGSKNSPGPDLPGTPERGLLSSTGKPLPEVPGKPDTAALAGLDKAAVKRRRSVGIEERRRSIEALRMFDDKMNPLPEQLMPDGSRPTDTAYDGTLSRWSNFKSVMFSVVPTGKNRFNLQGGSQIRRSRTWGNAIRAPSISEPRRESMLRDLDCAVTAASDVARSGSKAVPEDKEDQRSCSSELSVGSTESAKKRTEAKQAAAAAKARAQSDAKAAEAARERERQADEERRRREADEERRRREADEAGRKREADEAGRRRQADEAGRRRDADEGRTRDDEARRRDADPRAKASKGPEADEERRRREEQQGPQLQEAQQRPRTNQPTQRAQFDARGLRIEKAAFDQVYTLVQKEGEEIGHGASSTVKLCKSLRGGTYAVKIMTLKNENDVLWRHLAKEVRLLQQLTHENVVKLHAFFLDGNTAMLVMDYYSGGSLTARLMQQPGRQLPQDIVRSLVLQLLRGIDYLHRNSVVHRDVKPDNLCLEHTSVHSTLKLIDFGFATVVNPGEYLTQCCGTYEFMALEIFHDQGYGKMVDTWACGVSVYVLLMGRFPKVSGYISSRIRKQKDLTEVTAHDIAKIVDVSSLPSLSAKHLVKALLRPQPEKRATAADALKCNFVNLSMDPDEEEPKYVRSDAKRRATERASIMRGAAEQAAALHRKRESRVNSLGQHPAQQAAAAQAMRQARESPARSSRAPDQRG